MKKFLLTSLSVVSLSMPIFGQIQYRPAILGDVETLFNMFDNFTQDDAQRLLVFPPQERRAALTSCIEKNRIFVAVDHKISSIVGFVKLFLIDDQDELAEILGSELRLGQGDPLVDCSYLIDAKRLGDFSTPLHANGSILADGEYAVLCSGNNACMYIYYGSAYTIPSYRDLRVNTNLMKFALEQIQAYCTAKINQEAYGYCALVYGQSEATKHQQGMIRSFAFFANQITSPCAQINVQHLAYRSYKPVLVFDEEEQKIRTLPDTEENKGQGNLAIVKLG